MKQNKIEVYIDDSAYAINDEDSILIFKRSFDSFNNMYYSPVSSFISPAKHSTYAPNAELYDALKTLINRYSNLEYHSRLEKELRD